MMCFGILGWSASNIIHYKLDIGVAELGKRLENMIKNWRYLLKDYLKLCLSSLSVAFTDMDTNEFLYRISHFKT